MFDIGDSINKYFYNSVSSLLDTAFKAIAQLLFQQQAMPDFFNNLYTLFVTLGATLMSIIVAYRIVVYITQTSTGTNDTPLAEILVSTVKASAMLVIAPVLLKILVGEIAYPLGDWMFSKIAKNTSTATANYLTGGVLSDLFGEKSSFVFWVMLAFITVAVVIFFLKMCQYHAELIVYQLASVLAAISITTSDMNFMSEWWKGLLMMIVTILMQTAFLVGVTEILVNTATWYNFMLLIGFCCLIMKGPDLLKRMWYSTGTSRGFMRLLGERLLKRKFF